MKCLLLKNVINLNPLSSFGQLIANKLQSEFILSNEHDMNSLLTHTPMISLKSNFISSRYY
jgi:hypothetical protein